MMNQNETNQRIAILDSFRFIAISFVILYHFYPPKILYSLNPQIYNYQDGYSFLDYGYFGVHFFFIISGFVIASTLHKTNTLLIFLKKRLIRLIPSMFVCSFLTYVFCLAFDSDNLFPRSHSFSNFLFSTSFVSPLIIENDFFRYIGLKLNYVNGSYWSLWPEIQFYALASIIYYYDSKKFFSKFAIVATVIAIIHLLISSDIIFSFLNISRNSRIMATLSKLDIVFNLSTYIPWFLAGICFYQLKFKLNPKASIIFLVVSILFIVNTANNLNALFIIIAMISIFLIFVFNPKFLSILENRFFVSLGMSSYTLYLIHSNIGLVLLHNYSHFFGKLSPIFPILIIVTFFYFSLIIFKYIEKPFANYFRKSTNEELKKNQML